MAESIEDIRSQKIKDLVAEMKLYNNPQELEDMKKLIKKNVPLSMRGYLLAYLYINSREGQSVKQKPRAEKKPQTAKPALENAVSLYVNIGRMSKGSAHEMTDFLCQCCSDLKQEDIFSVAYKQNYSFVYIRKDLAESVIQAVAGQTYKGRKVKINYSKDKDEQQTQQQ